MSDELKRFLDTHSFPGRVLFAKVAGSRGHNLATARSDWDFAGVYAAHPRDLFRLTKPEETCDNKEGSEPNFSFHEAGKFARLVLAGNPTIIEMLWTGRMYQSTWEWDWLRQRRDRFLSHKVIKSYLGFVGDQLRKLKRNETLHTTGGGFNNKWAYHIVRLLYDVESIARGRPPHVWKDEDGEQKRTIMEIRTTGWPREKVEEYVEAKIAEVDGMKPWPWPEQGDRDLLDEWLWLVRSEDMGRC